jgi:hypothetical protein
MGWSLQRTANEARRHAQYAFNRARHIAQKVDHAVTAAARTAVHVAKGVDRAAQFARPVYSAVRPLLHHSVTGPLDRVATTYDTIRRSI